MGVRPFELPDLGQGIRYGWMDDGEGGGTVVSQQNHEAILEQNKAMATHNDGYTPSRDMRRVASIPMTLIHKWLTEEGWDAFAPESAEKLKAKLNDSSFLYLRTAPGRL